MKVDRDRAARYGISAENVLAAVEAGGAGRVVGTVFEGQRRFGLAVRMKQDGKLDPQGFASIPVAAPDGCSSPWARSPKWLWKKVRPKSAGKISRDGSWSS